MAAAVGSLMSVSTCKPAAPAQSLVAWRGKALELAGMGTTALVNGSPRPCSASFLSRLKSMTAICSVRRFWPTNGTRSGVPRMRLMERMERCSSKFSLASCPKARVPSRRMVTMEGVYFCPSWLGTTSAWPNWKFATTELLVPKSIPMYGMLSLTSGERPDRQGGRGLAPSLTVGPWSVLFGHEHLGTTQDEIRLLA